MNQNKNSTFQIALVYRQRIGQPTVSLSLSFSLIVVLLSFSSGPTLTRMSLGACETQASQPVERHSLMLSMGSVTQTRDVCDPGAVVWSYEDFLSEYFGHLVVIQVLYVVKRQ